ncbi:lamin tail domain-containing protein [Streptomyces sp. NPDC047022]|uniref:lamin tail domain-containing protein n=1 Tax=Streptomyces sp. NPDC047022 TaxID=3155737 RepID=UPI0033EF6423
MSVSTSVAARRLAATALAAGAAVGAVSLPASAAGHHDRAIRPSVEISHVQHETLIRAPRTNRALNGEWVEIANSTRRAVNLSGWTLRDEAGHTYRFHHYLLGGRAAVRVHTGVGHDSRTDLYQDLRFPVWAGRSDSATLRNELGRVIDSVSWGRGVRHGR